MYLNKYLWKNIMYVQQLTNWKDKRKSTPSYTPKVIELEPSLDDLSSMKDTRSQKTFKQLMDKKYIYIYGIHIFIFIYFMTSCCRFGRNEGRD